MIRVHVIDVTKVAYRLVTEFPSQVCSGGSGEARMGSSDRFYMMELRHRAALHGDVGSLLQIEGLVIGGEGARAVFMLPDAPPFEQFMTNPPVSKFTTLRLTPEQWTDWLQRSDQPEILVQDSMEKVFHRKLRYDISGAVQQKVWAADGFKCVFCKQPMGRVQLTIDHWIPLERGGVNDTSNYLSVCRRENKDKGAMDPKEWCELRGYDYMGVVAYLTGRQIS